MYIACISLKASKHKIIILKIQSMLHFMYTKEFFTIECENLTMSEYPGNQILVEIYVIMIHLTYHSIMVLVRRSQLTRIRTKNNILGLFADRDRLNQHQLQGMDT